MATKQQRALCFELLKKQMKDRRPGSDYQAWKDNIAMAFYDEFRNWLDKGRTRRQKYGRIPVHRMANQAADDFLKRLFGKKV